MKMKESQFLLIKEQLKKLTGKECFYKHKLEGINVDQIQSQEDFEKLPFTWKGDLREAYPLGLMAEPEDKIVRIHSSSGTTGTPVIIPYTQQDVDDWALMFARCYEMAGITNMDRIQINMVFWKTDIKGFTSPGFVDFMDKKGAKVYGILADEYRFVTSHDTPRRSLDQVVQLIREYIHTL